MAESNQKVTAKFTISGVLPGLNEIIGAARYNRFAGSAQKKTQTRRCEWSIVAGSVPTFAIPVNVHFRWIEKDKRRDPDNIRAGAKFILDALVNLEILPGDGKRWILGLSDEFPKPDSKNPRVEVTIEGTNGSQNQNDRRKEV